MGRPPNRKTGAYTAAERQQRRRKKLKRQQREAVEAERIAAREAEHRVGLRQQAEHQRWAAHVRSERPPVTIADLADDLAEQIARVIDDFPGVTIDDLRAALDRLFGPSDCAAKID
jgi:hypothetical protein